LSQAQLSRGQLLQDPTQISFVSQHRFLELAALEANDSLLGLHVAAEMDLRDAGILFYLAAASATVAEVLEHLARYSGTTSEAVRFEMARRKDETVLTEQRVVAFDESPRQFSEFSTLAVMRLVSLRSILMTASALNSENCRGGPSTATARRSVRTVSSLCRAISKRTASLVIPEYRARCSSTSATVADEAAR